MRTCTLYEVNDSDAGELFEIAKTIMAGEVKRVTGGFVVIVEDANKPKWKEPTKLCEHGNPAERGCSPRECEALRLQTEELRRVYESLDGWKDVAATLSRNTDYYRDLVVQCGKAIGKEAYIADDATTSEDVLCAKVPELVEGVCTKLAAAEATIRQLEKELHSTRELALDKASEVGELKAARKQLIDHAVGSLGRRFGIYP